MPHNGHPVHAAALPSRFGGLAEQPILRQRVEPRAPLLERRRHPRHRAGTVAGRGLDKPEVIELDVVAVSVAGPAADTGADEAVAVGHPSHGLVAVDRGDRHDPAGRRDPA